MAKFCRKCGTALVDGICPNCSKSVEKEDVNTKKLEEIDKLDNCWQTEESKIYDMYKEKFKEKLPELNNVSSMLEILASTLQRKIDELKDATNSAENIFL